MPATITKIQNIHYETLAFLATYIIPLASFDLDFGLEPPRTFAVFIAMLLLIGAIYIRTNLYYTNPTLAIFGYRVYKISTATKTDIIVVSLGRLKQGDQIRTRNIEEDIYFSKKIK
ncbi:MAG: hypothetical protein IPP83_09790 [Flavobacteriales bacterium]|nr:hypothetical protein [Flavobacteriales bacterium]